MSQESAQKQFKFLQKYLNSSRKESKATKHKTTEKPTKSKDEKVEDDVLTQ